MTSSAKCNQSSVGSRQSTVRKASPQSTVRKAPVRGPQSAGPLLATGNWLLTEEPPSSTAEALAKAVRRSLNFGFLMSDFGLRPPNQCRKQISNFGTHG